ncbi:hypothetical protein FQZ97_407200 [compost metagenome]
MPQLLAGRHFHDSTVLFDEIGLGYAMLGGQLVDNRFRGHARRVSMLLAVLALDDLGFQPQPLGDVDRIPFKLGGHHEVETGVSQVALDCRLPVVGGRFYQVAKHLHVGARQCLPHTVQRKTDPFGVVSPSSHHPRPGAFLVSQLVTELTNSVGDRRLGGVTLQKQAGFICPDQG